uniref:hypothetical protein n=1 Tax=Pararhizobium sp. IMCC3301 TaxID=3067904 RepID=UPI002742188D|nr:hypothetical protein [Pararhizobium sp. IMCC3301]
MAKRIDTSAHRKNRNYGPSVFLRRVLWASAAVLFRLSHRRTGPPQIGYVGNLAAEWIDWLNIREMVQRQPSAEFTFWGPLPKEYQSKPNLAAILEMPNCVFPGLTSPSDIIEACADIDVWLLCFKAKRVLGRPVNSPKMLEYLATGKTVVGSWLEAYQDSELVSLADEGRADKTPALLDHVLGQLDKFNSVDLMRRRREFALAHSYDRHLDQILSLIGSAPGRDPLP